MNGDNEFGIAKQRLLIDHMLTEEQIFQRAANILKPSYFDAELQSSVKYILEHANEFRALPTVAQIQVETEQEFHIVEGIREQDTDWALDSLEQFCKRQAIVQAVFDSPDHISDGNYGMVEAIIKEAMEVSLQKDLGTDYFLNPKERLERMRLTTLIPTGWQDVDRKLYGGMNKGELTIFAGASGAGKSLFLQNLALNWIEGPTYEYGGTEHNFDPLHIVYITMELSEELISKRLDTMVTGVDARDIFKRIDEVHLKVILHGKKSGNLRIKYMPSGSTSADIRAFLKEHEIQTGRQVDGICVDYLDLMYPSAVKISASDLFVKDKYVTEELRSLAADLDILCATASQLNRSAIDESEHSQAMIAGGISKINTADNVMSIVTTQSMRERGEYQLQFLKTRSSAGVGSKAYLAFDQTSMRIRNGDAPFDDDEDAGTTRDTVTGGLSGLGNKNILNRLKHPVTKPIPEAPAKEAEGVVLDKNEHVIYDGETGEILVDAADSTDDDASKPENMMDRLKKLRQEGRM